MERPKTRSTASIGFFILGHNAVGSRCTLPQKSRSQLKGDRLSQLGVKRLPSDEPARRGIYMESCKLQMKEPPKRLQRIKAISESGCLQNLRRSNTPMNVELLAGQDDRENKNDQAIGMGSDSWQATKSISSPRFGGFLSLQSLIVVSFSYRRTFSVKTENLISMGHLRTVTQ